MNSKITRVLIVFSVFLTGIMAGLNFDRYTVQVPAWRNLPVESWVAYSRFADLGNGIVLYPVLGFGTMILTVVAAISYFTDKKAGKKSAVRVMAAAIFAALGMIFTIYAAPQMLSQRSTDNHTFS